MKNIMGTKMNKKIFSIKTKLELLFSVCILALVVLLSVIVNIQITKQNKLDFYKNANAQLEHIANGIKIFFGETLNTLDMLSKNEDVRNADDTIHTHTDMTVPVRVDSIKKSATEKKLVTLFKNVDSAFPDYVEVYLGTKWGGYASCFDGEMAAGYDPRKRGWYQLGASGNGQAMITDAFASTVGAVVVGLTKSFYDFNNEFVGNVSIEVTLNTLTDIISNSKIGRTGYVVLVQEDGTILADPRHNEFNFKNMTETGIKGYAELAALNGSGPDMYADGKKWATDVYSVGDPKWKLIAFIEKSEIANNALFIVRIIIIVGICLLLVFGAIVVLFSGRMLAPLTPIKNALSLLEKGDFSNGVKVSGNDEFYVLANSFNSFINKIQYTVSALKDSESLIDVSSQKLNDGAENTVKSINEINTEIEEFNSTIKKQTGSVQQTASAVEQISSNIDSLGNMIETQGAAVNNASASVEQMLANIKSVNDSVLQLSQSYKELEKNSEEGVYKHKAMNEKISLIEAESKTLADANKVISDIAGRTNLLAINAAIEAAHAGAAGLGFGVVADEIRKLSESSSVQSKTIAQKLTDIQKSITDVVVASEDAGFALNGISEKISDTNGLVREISNAMQEQESGSKSISSSLLTLNNSFSEVKTASNEMNSGSKLILQEVLALRNVSDEMKTKMLQLDTKSGSMKTVQEELSALSKELNNALSILDENINKFKV